MCFVVVVSIRRLQNILGSGSESEGVSLPGSPHSGSGSGGPGSPGTMWTTAATDGGSGRSRSPSPHSDRSGIVSIIL